MRSIHVRGKVLGHNKIAVCVPITKSDSNEIIRQVKEVVKCEPDVIEVRIDFWVDHIFDNLSKYLIEIRETIGDIPLLLTYRSEREGGQGKFDHDKLMSIYAEVILCDAVDLIDLELSLGEKYITLLVEKAKGSKILTVLSYHNFAETPNEEILISKLKLAQQLGGDLGKIATMPKIKQDVITLLSATTNAYSQLDIPIIAISMGELGEVSRICGGFFGSTMTFASLPDQPSAPGQVEVRKLKKLLQLIEN